jgi:hypothetical protein
MSHYDYLLSKALAENEATTFDALVMAAMRKADTYNQGRLMMAFPWTWQELQARYDAPDGILDTDEPGGDQPVVPIRACSCGGACYWRFAADDLESAWVCQRCGNEYRSVDPDDIFAPPDTDDRGRPI